MSNEVLESGVPGSAAGLLQYFDISESDLRLVAEFGTRLQDRMPEFVDRFYDWLRDQPYDADFFPTERVRERARGAQIQYWQTFFHGVVDEAYVEQRRHVGRVHAEIDLPLDAYMAGMTRFISIAAEIDNEAGHPDPVGLATAVTKLLNLDQMITADTYSQRSAEKLVDQSAALTQMSTPVTTIWDGILLLPLVGVIDSKRAMEITARVLEQIQAAQANSFILDISGVAVIDTAVANYLIRITKGTKLMGCETIISGLSPSIAQTIVGLGIDVGDVRTTGNLRDALRLAFGGVGISVARSESAI